MRLLLLGSNKAFAFVNYCTYNNAMELIFDDQKRTKTLDTRDLDFADAGEIFAGHHFNVLDDRKDYGEDRYITVGMLKGRMVIMVWTPHGEARRIISMRKANEREQEKYRHRLD